MPNPYQYNILSILGSGWYWHGNTKSQITLRSQQKKLDLKKYRNLKFSIDLAFDTFDIFDTFKNFGKSLGSPKIRSLKVFERSQDIVDNFDWQCWKC